VSGRDHDKLADAGLTVEHASVVAAPIISEFPYALECRVSHVVEIGAYRLVVGEVLESHADENVLNAEGTGVDIEALDPLVYIAGAREYRSLGGKVADAFEAGRELTQNRP
jgi:flavin reductase (DIM6/NTAB) family NADH-FMN oxidoreductase RutF